MQIAIVIPAYNEQRSIVDVVTRALQQADQVIVVDDGSSDQTLPLLQALQEKNPKLVVLTNEKNMGKAASLWNGMRYAEHLGVDAIITLDADGQHCPEDIPRFIHHAQQHPQTIIIGARLADKTAIPAKRYYANKFANFWLSWAAGYVIDDSQSGFRLYPTELIRKLTPDIQRSKSFVFESEILIDAAKYGFKSIPIKIEAIYNPDARPSHFRGVTDILLITRMVAWSLISRGMYPMGLLNITIMRLFKGKHTKAIGADGIAMLLLSVTIIVLTAGLSYFYFLYKTFNTAKKTPSYIHDADVILLLGMRLKKDKIHQLYQQRLDKANELLHSHPNLKVIILGGLTGNATITEADAGKHYLLSKNITAERIITEQQSRHTLENLKSAKKLIDTLKFDNVVLLTNRFHLYRALTLAQGFKIIATPCAAENIFSYRLRNILRIISEAFFSHWYITGKLYAFTTKNKHMLNRIS